ncbi:unnamed protein product [Mytilus coruscus]|uniref:Uncharacterized protein n=1 Tax=Mytilus coruscus TaxID=42192 RepID=A0A6J8E2R2_MYTCO|nr:unnamed protein product [Mytilus coruscus]
MNSKKKGNDGRKRRNSNAQNSRSEKPGKQNCGHNLIKGKNVTKVKDNFTEKDLIMNNNNAMNSFTPNFISPVLQGSGNFQQYQNIQNPSSPMSGFYGIPYTPQGPIPQPVCNSTMNQPIDKSSDNEESEETGEILKQFMTKELILSNPNEFVRAHRFGREDKKPRPIVCRFKTFNDRELVRKNANVHNGTNYGISEQFPKEVNDRRKVLWPYFKEAKEQHKKAHFKREKLYIDGKDFIPDDRNNHNMQTDNNPTNTRCERQGARPKHFPRRGPQKKNNGNSE